MPETVCEVLDINNLILYSQQHYKVGIINIPFL